jgi:hypothetical protein
MMAPVAPGIAPQMIGDAPADAYTHAPQNNPMTIREMNPGGAVRLGVWGSLSITYSLNAPSENIATAIDDPMNAKDDP